MQLDGTSQESNDGIEAEEDEEQLYLLEPWHDFLSRTSRWSEEHLKAAGQKEWLTIWRARQWNWATRLVNDDSQKWSATATQWQPPLHCWKPSGRLQARPRKRWEQDLVDFLAFWKPGSRETWQELAARPSEWERLKDAFVNYTCQHRGLSEAKRTTTGGTPLALAAAVAERITLRRTCENFLRLGPTHRPDGTRNRHDVVK